VTSALNFNTPDCNITGGCDLYTTKSTGSDKKLYKSIDKDLSSQHAALLKLGATLSAPDREAMLASSPSMQLFSHSSAFGPLSELSSRRAFAYLIATLNASHPHYDFSHVLRPGDFKRERNLRRVMGNLDSILQNVRPGGQGGGEAHGGDGGSALADVGADAVWGPHCWAKIDSEMHLNDCIIFSYHPEIDPFEEEESAIYAAHYFFFHRALKRVAYLYLRVVPVISAQSPQLRPSQIPSASTSNGAAAASSSSGVAKSGSGGKRRRALTLDPSGGGGGGTSNKRARFWLGDRDHADRAVAAPYDDDEEQDDGLTWNRGEDGELVLDDGDDYDDADYYYDGDDGDGEDDESVSDEEDSNDAPATSPIRGMSEDVVASLEI
jgi:hypothetical protein